MMLRICAARPTPAVVTHRISKRTAATVKDDAFKSLSARDARQQYNAASKKIFDKLPSLFQHKVPHKSLFTNDAHMGPDAKRLKTDTRIDTRLTRHVTGIKALAPEDRPRMVTTFAEMGLHPDVQEALAEMQVVAPSSIQQTAIAVAAQGKSVVVTAPTGTGKTLAALAPMFHRMMIDREQGIELRKNRPRAVIVAPTFELVHQLWGVANRLGERTGFAVREMYGAMGQSEMETQADGKYDVLVTTPLGYRRMREQGYCIDTDVKYYMFDEADVTIGGTHHTDAQTVDSETFLANLKPLLAKQFERESYLGRHKVQFFIVAASWTDAFRTKVEKWIPFYVPVHEDKTHQAPRCLHHRFYIAPRTQHYDQLRGILAQQGVQPNKKFFERIERSKRNFWFPDAVTFETGMFSPLDQGSHVLAKHGPGTEELPDQFMKSRMGDSPRPAYKREYVEAPKYLPEPAAMLLPDSQRATPMVVEVPVLTEGEQQHMLEGGGPKRTRAGFASSAWEEEEEEGGADAASDTAAAAVVPTTKQLIIPRRHSEHKLAVVNKHANNFVEAVLPPAPRVDCGVVKATAAPFTGLPQLTPQQQHVKGARCMVFFDTVKHLKKVAKQLVADGYAVAVMRGMDGPLGHEVRVAEFERWAKGEVSVLLTTDIASRGLDHYVQTVVNYGMPAYPVDYINRAGRAGRFGRRGAVHNIVDKNNSDQRQFANQMEHRLAKQQKLENIAANAEQMKKPLGMFLRKQKENNDRKWLKVSSIGFASRSEYSRMKFQLIESQMRRPINPRHPMGLRGKLGEKDRKKLYAKGQHLAWQMHMRKTNMSPFSLLKKGPQQVTNLGSSTRDLRTSYLMKPMSDSQFQSLRKRYGHYLRASPVHLHKSKTGKYLTGVRSSIPSMHGQ